LAARQFTVGVVGLGHIGLRVAVQFAREADVVALDVEPGRVAAIFPAESMTVLGTTRAHLTPVLEESGAVIGRDFNLADTDATQL
jgi:UDP-N-acetyl-D-mannosaminuronate dehydrogenase